jgi:hypothetical protein
MDDVQNCNTHIDMPLSQGCRSWYHFSLFTTINVGVSYKFSDLKLSDLILASSSILKILYIYICMYILSCQWRNMQLVNKGLSQYIYQFMRISDPNSKQTK